MPAARNIELERIVFWHPRMSGSSSDSNLTAAFPLPDLAAAVSPSPEIETEVLELFDVLRERLFRYLLSFSLDVSDAEEIIQETFLALFQHLQRGKSRRNLRGWLFRVAHNLALRKRRHDWRGCQITPAEELVIDPAPNPEDEFLSNQTSSLLMTIVDALPERDQRCLFLRAEGLRYREIAAILDMSLGSVSLSLGRSLARLGRVGKASAQPAGGLCAVEKGAQPAGALCAVEKGAQPAGALCAKRNR
jgi:RNA polymerase sigma-70 factor (ECF subfamily)